MRWQLRSVAVLELPTGLSCHGKAAKTVYRSKKEQMNEVDRALIGVGDRDMHLRREYTRTCRKPSPSGALAACPSARIADCTAKNFGRHVT